MDAIKLAAGTESGPISVFLRGGVVMLTMLTAAIHASLGGLLFTLNAAVYLALAVAMILPVSRRSGGSPASPCSGSRARPSQAGSSSGHGSSWPTSTRRSSWRCCASSPSRSGCSTEGPAGDVRRLRRLGRQHGESAQGSEHPMTRLAMRAALGGAALALLVTACSTASGSRSVRRRRPRLAVRSSSPTIWPSIGHAWRLAPARPSSSCSRIATAPRTTSRSSMPTADRPSSARRSADPPRGCMPSRHGPGRHLPVPV